MRGEPLKFTENTVSPFASLRKRPCTHCIFDREGSMEIPFYPGLEVPLGHALIQAWHP